MKTIVCYGDSNTYGYNPENGFRYEYEERWTTILQKELKDSAIVIPEGLNGRTTSFEDELRPGRNGATYLDPCLHSHGPIDLVVLMLGTNDLPRAIKFYDPLMALLGHVKAGRNEQGASWGTFNGNHTCGLCVGVPFDQQPAGVGNGTMVALNARSVEHIAELHALALQLGGRDEGAPGHRPQYGNGFHSAYVRDPDGNKLAFVYYASAA